MSRRTAILVGSLVAVLAASEIIVLSGLLAAERRDDRQRYARAITEQRRAAGRVARVGREHVDNTSVRTTFLCVHGVETFAQTVARALHADIVSADRRLDVDELRQLSNQAMRAQRYVEQANAGPALPQRMGRTHIQDEGDEVHWRAIEPPRVECDDGDAFARVRLEVESSPPPGSTGKP